MKKLLKFKIIILISLCLIILFLIFNFILINTNTTTTTNIYSIYKKEKFLANEEIHNNIYYVSSSGTSFDGTNINDPMSLSIAINKKYYTGDKILLKSGDIFYGKLNFSTIDINNDEKLYIGKYGGEKNPIVTSAKIVNNKEAWEEVQENIYRLDLTNTNLFLGYNGTDENSCNIGFIRVNNEIYGGLKDDLELLKNDFDYYLDGKYIYIFLKNNLDVLNQEIILAARVDLLKLYNNTEVENLTFQDTGAHAIVKGSYPLKNVIIHNNIIKDIGGSYINGINNKNKTRYGNGIEFYLGADNVIIKNNLISNIYDAGITLQGTSGKWNSFLIENNILINCSYSFEFWAIDSSKGFENIKIKNNFIINDGKGWSQKYRPNTYNSANFVFFTIEDNKKLNFSIENNKLINSERLYYIIYTLKDKFKKEININNNNYFINKENYIVNNIRNNKIKEYLNNEYNIENNSVFEFLEDEDINKILECDNVLKLDEINKINKYYINFTKMIKMKPTIQKLLENNLKLRNSYIEFCGNEQTEKLNHLENELNNLINDFSNNDYDRLKNIYLLQYSIIDSMIDKEIDNSLESNENINSNILQSIKIIEDYENLFNIYQANENIDNSKIEEELNNIIEEYNNNLDLDLNNEGVLLKQLKEYYQKNTINNNLISDECSIVKKIIDKKIKEKADEEYKLINATSDKDLSKLTNEDVYISLKLPNEKSIIINNDGKNQIEFSENGEFTFKINIRGYDYEYKVAVNNIDKKAPELNIDNTNNILSVDVKDENLKEIHIEKDGKKITKTKDINIPGIYTISAIDKVNNEAVKKAIVYGMYKENDKEKKYIPLDYNKEIQVSEIVQNTDYIIEENEQKLTNDSIVKTGDKLLDGKQEYTIIVKGDLTNSGNSGIVDLIKLRKQLVSTEELSEENKIAADLNYDDNVNIIDLIKLRKKIVGVEE